MDSISFKKLCMLMTLTVLVASNGGAFAPIATEPPTTPAITEAHTPENPAAGETSQATEATDNIPDDQLSLPLSLKQFQTLQTLIQKNSENATKLIDQFTKDTDDLQKKFNEFLDDLLKEPAN